MFDALRRWRTQRVLRTAAMPDALWHEALDALPFLAIYTDDELRGCARRSCCSSSRRASSARTATR